MEGSFVGIIFGSNFREHFVVFATLSKGLRCYAAVIWYARRSSFRVLRMAQGWSFSVSFTSGLRGLGDTNIRCTVLGHRSLVPALLGSIHKETPERAYVVGSLASGRAGGFNDCSRFRMIAV